jgi:hypothetical protein
MRGSMNGKFKNICSNLHGVTPRNRNSLRLQHPALSVLQSECYATFVLTKHVLQHHTTHTRVNTDYILEVLYEE